MNRISFRLYSGLSKVNTVDLGAILNKTYNKFLNMANKMNHLESQLKVIERDNDILKTRIVLLETNAQYKINYKLKYLEEKLIKINNKSNHKHV